MALSRSGVAVPSSIPTHSVVVEAKTTPWGDNSSGQINVPAGLSGVVATAGSQWHSMALKSNGTVVAWGYNAFGATNVPPDVTNVVAIAAGAWHNVALLEDENASPQVIARSRRSRLSGTAGVRS